MIPNFKWTNVIGSKCTFTTDTRTISVLPGLVLTFEFYVVSVSLFLIIFLLLFLKKYNKWRKGRLRATYAIRIVQFRQDGHFRLAGH